MLSGTPTQARTGGLNTAAALTDVYDNCCRAGEWAYVKNLGHFYLDPQSTAAIDAVTVIATRSGHGRWLVGLPSLNLPTIADLYLDPIAGNDSLDGLTPATAIQTQVGITRILGLLPLFRQPFVLHVIGTGPLSENLTLNWNVGATVVQIVGQEVTVGTPPALDFVQPRDPASNTPLLIGAGAFAWGPAVDKIAVIVASANPAHVGARAAIVHDDGGTAETSSWMVTDPLTMALDPVEIVPDVGDVIEIVESFPVTGDLNINVIGPWTDTPGKYKFVFRGFDLESLESSSFISNGLQSYIVDTMLRSSLYLVNLSRINLNKTVGSELVTNTTTAVGLFPTFGDTIYGGSSNGVDQNFVSPCRLNVRNGFLVRGAKILTIGRARW